MPNTLDILFSRHEIRPKTYFPSNVLKQFKHGFPAISFEAGIISFWGFPAT
jgi:hypothetical protein